MDEVRIENKMSIFFAGYAVFKSHVIIIFVFHSLCRRRNTGHVNTFEIF